MVARFAVIALLLGACSVGQVGGLRPPGDDTPQMDAPMGGGGEASFNITIKPLTTGRCTGCHEAAQPPNLSSFTALQAKYKTPPGLMNILVTKGDLTAGVHAGAAYFGTAEQQEVAAWIDAL